MERERKIKRKSLSKKKTTEKTHRKTKALDSQTSSQVNLRIAVSQMNAVVGDFKYNVIVFKVVSRRLLNLELT